MDSVLAVFLGAASGKKMTSPKETYRAAILQTFEAHLARVQAARNTRDLAVARAKNFGEHDLRRLAVYAAANKEYEKALRGSDAQRAKEDATALAALRAVVTERAL